MKKLTHSSVLIASLMMALGATAARDAQADSGSVTRDESSARCATIDGTEVGSGIREGANSSGG